MTDYHYEDSGGEDGLPFRMVPVFERASGFFYYKYGIKIFRKKIKLSIANPKIMLTFVG